MYYIKLISAVVLCGVLCNTLGNVLSCLKPLNFDEPFQWRKAILNFLYSLILVYIILTYFNDV